MSRRVRASGAMRGVIAACALAVFVCVLAVLSADEVQPASAAPPNDTFANAITITPPLLSGYVASGSNVGATIGPGTDPIPSCAGSGGRIGTVWYRWTPATGGYISFDTFGSDFNTTLAIYSGPDQNHLTEVACGNDFGAPQSALRATFASGTTYYLQISSPTPATGNIVLNSARGMDIVVTGSDDTNVSDTYLTLREAMLMAQGAGTTHLGRSLSTEEANLILGEGTSANSADIIHFTPNSFYPTSPTWIALGSALPSLTDTGNTISGLGAGVVIDGQNLNFTCLDITSNGNNVEGLEFRRCYGASFPAAVRTSGSNTVIGGSSIPAQRNAFSTNSVAIAAIPPGTGNRIFGNNIGTSAAGTYVSGNALGIAVTGASNQVGGSGPGEGNLLGSSTYEQIVIRNSTATGNTVRGNRIGVLSGSSGAWGVRIDTQAQANTIGGTSAGDGNIIEAATVGVLIESGPNNVAQGNKIGTDASGTTAKSNSVGVEISGPATGITIGGSAVGAGNIISGNTNEGIIISSANGNTVQANYIGANATGGAALPNGLGIGLYDSAGNTIGGTAAGAGNLISGNSSDGVLIDNSNGNNGSPNTLLNNIIGSHPDSAVAMPNYGAGVHIQNSAGNQIGSTVPGGGNIIAFNNAGGVRVDNGSPVSNANTIRGNSIFANVGQGIDLTGGANAAIAAPVVTSTGSAHGTACNNCTVDVYSDGEDEGRTFLGTATADGSGNWSYPGAVVGPNVTAIATDGGGNSSEFSTPFSCGACTAAPTPSATPSPAPTPTASATATPVGQTPSPTPTGTTSGSPSGTPSPTETATATAAPSESPTVTASPGSSETPTPTLTATQTPSPSGSTTATPVSSLIHGDANCDGHVDLDDSLTILEESEGLVDSCAGTQTFHVAIDDVNCDGVVTGVDSLDLLRHLAGVAELPLPPECPQVGETL